MGNETAKRAQNARAGRLPPEGGAFTKRTKGRAEGAPRARRIANDGKIREEPHRVVHFRKDGVSPTTQPSSRTPIGKPKAVSPMPAVRGRRLHGTIAGSSRPLHHGHRRDAGVSHPDSHHVLNAKRESNLRTPTANVTTPAATEPPAATSTLFETTSLR